MTGGYRQQQAWVGVRNKANFRVGPGRQSGTSGDARPTLRNKANFEPGACGKQSQSAGRGSGREAAAGRSELHGWFCETKPICGIPGAGVGNAGLQGADAQCSKQTQFQGGPVTPNKANLSCRADGVHGTPYGRAQEVSCETKPIVVEDKGGTPSPRAWPCVRNKAKLGGCGKADFLGGSGREGLVVVVWME